MLRFFTDVICRVDGCQRKSLAYRLIDSAAIPTVITFFVETHSVDWFLGQRAVKKIGTVQIEGKFCFWSSGDAINGIEGWGEGS